MCFPASPGVEATSGCGVCVQLGPMAANIALMDYLQRAAFGVLQLLLRLCWVTVRLQAAVLLSAADEFAVLYGAQRSLFSEF